MAEGRRPVGGRDYPRTYQEFRSWFPEEATCREYLAGLRWPHGVLVSRLRQRWLLADGHRVVDVRVSCGLKTSATAGTIFHRSHTPLSTWFAAVWFVTSQKNRGVGAGFAGRSRVRFL